MIVEMFYKIFLMEALMMKDNNPVIDFNFNKDEYQYNKIFFTKDFIDCLDDDSREDLMSISNWRFKKLLSFGCYSDKHLFIMPQCYIDFNIQYYSHMHKIFNIIYTIISNSNFKHYHYVSESNNHIFTARRITDLINKLYTNAELSYHYSYDNGIFYIDSGHTPCCREYNYDFLEYDGMMNPELLNGMNSEIISDITRDIANNTLKLYDGSEISIDEIASKYSFNINEMVNNGTIFKISDNGDIAESYALYIVMFEKILEDVRSASAIFQDPFSNIYERIIDNNTKVESDEYNNENFDNRTDNYIRYITSFSSDIVSAMNELKSEHRITDNILSEASALLESLLSFRNLVSDIGARLLSRPTVEDAESNVDPLVENGRIYVDIEECIDIEKFIRLNTYNFSELSRSAQSKYSSESANNAVISMLDGGNLSLDIIANKNIFDKLNALIKFNDLELYKSNDNPVKPRVYIGNCLADMIHAVIIIDYPLYLVNENEVFTDIKICNRFAITIKDNTVVKIDTDIPLDAAYFCNYDEYDSYEFVHFDSIFQAPHVKDSVPCFGGYELDIRKASTENDFQQLVYVVAHFMQHYDICDEWGGSAQLFYDNH